MIKHKQEGFGTIQIVLLVIALIMIGSVAFFAASSNKDGNSSPFSTQKSKKDSSPKSSDLAIGEWGVHAAQGNLKLSYKASGNKADFSSDELVAADQACAGKGGAIYRFAPKDNTGPAGGGLTAEDAAKTNKTYVHLADGYYYLFVHSSGICGDANKTFALQQQTNDAVKTFATRLAPVKK